MIEVSSFGGKDLAKLLEAGDGAGLGGGRRLGKGRSS